VIGLRRALWGLGAIGLLGGLALIPVGATSHHLTLRGLSLTLALLAGWGFIGAGLFVWYRRPENGLGGLMVATGFAWFLGLLSFSNNSLLFTLGSAFSVVFYATLMHLLLGFPDGRLHSALERVAVGTAYFVTLVAFPPVLLVADFRDFDCSDCPPNALLIERHESLAKLGVGALNVVGVVLAILVIVILWRRWQAATVPQRRTLWAVLFPGLAVMGMLAVTAGVSTAGAKGVSEIAGFAGVAAFALMPYVFLGGLARDRLAHGGAVRELVGRLSEAPVPGQLQDALRRALGDPSLKVLYWIPEDERYVDAEGVPAELPAPGSGRAVTDVERDGECVAAIVHDATLSAEEPELLAAVAAAAALALDNERLDAELRCRIEDLRSSRARLLEVGFTERRRLERNLHDGAQQRLVSLALSMRMARNKLRDDPAGAEDLLDSAARELDAALEELRELARGIHPAVLSDRGLDAALESLAARAPLPVELERPLGERLPGPVELAAYFVVAEALTNVVKYARASRARVRAGRENGALMVEISDDGIGGANTSDGSGLRGLADRLSVLEGRLEVESEVGLGTTIRATIPCA
jgi:signal transduction histidine kinase